MTHIAFDLGLATSGVCWGPDQWETFNCPKIRGGCRLAWWKSTFRHLLLPGYDTIVVEAPFFHTVHPSGSLALAGLHGVLELAAYEEGCNHISTPPTSLKKWATGTGNARKELMLAAAQERGYQGDDHNAADAYLLWHWYQTIGGNQ